MSGSHNSASGTQPDIQLSMMVESIVAAIGGQMRPINANTVAPDPRKETYDKFKLNYISVLS